MKKNVSNKVFLEKMNTSYAHHTFSSNLAVFGEIKQTMLSLHSELAHSTAKLPDPIGIKNKKRIKSLLIFTDDKSNVFYYLL